MKFQINKCDACGFVDRVIPMSKEQVLSCPRCEKGDFRFKELI